MKTKAIITSIILTIGTLTLSMAGLTENNLLLNINDGNMLCIPLKMEEASDAVPFDIREEFHKARLQQVNEPTDFSEMVKPEKEVDDLNIDLQDVFYSLRK